MSYDSASTQIFRLQKVSSVVNTVQLGGLHVRACQVLYTVCAYVEEGVSARLVCVYEGQTLIFLQCSLCHVALKLMPSWC